jgi:hypothetical protein
MGSSTVLDAPSNQTKEATATGNVKAAAPPAESPTRSAYGP